MQPLDNAERRPPWQESGVLDITRGGGDKRRIAAAALRLQAERCPWMRAAYRLGDPMVIAVVVRLHSPAQCQAVRRGGPRG